MLKLDSLRGGGREFSLTSDATDGTVGNPMSPPEMDTGRRLRNRIPDKRRYNNKPNAAKPVLLRRFSAVKPRSG